MLASFEGQVQLVARRKRFFTEFVASFAERVPESAARSATTNRGAADSQVGGDYFDSVD
jgi:hypothetical protein